MWLCLISELTLLEYNTNTDGIINNINEPQIPPVYVINAYTSLVYITIIIVGIERIIDHNPFIDFFSS
jgi:hypothetical protein